MSFYILPPSLPTITNSELKVSEELSEMAFILSYRAKAQLTGKNGNDPEHGGDNIVALNGDFSSTGVKLKGLPGVVWFIT